MRIVPLALCAMMCVALAAAEAPRQVTIRGTACCAKCRLGKTAVCQSALVVTEGGKKVVYYVTMDKKGRALHQVICWGPQAGISVTGVVSTIDGQKWITASKIEGLKPSAGKDASAT